MRFWPRIWTSAAASSGALKTFPPCPSHCCSVWHFLKRPSLLYCAPTGRLGFMRLWGLVRSLFKLALKSYWHKQICSKPFKLCYKETKWKCVPEFCSWKKHLTSWYTASFLAYTCQQHLSVALNSKEQLVLPISCLLFSNYVICSTKKALLPYVLRPSQLWLLE